MTLAIVFESVGVGEWFVLLAVVLVVVGPKRLPATARKIGNYYSKFRRAADSFKRQLMDMDTEIDRYMNEAKEEAKEAFTVEPGDDGLSDLDGHPGHMPYDGAYNPETGEYEDGYDGGREVPGEQEASEEQADEPAEPEETLKTEPDGTLKKDENGDKAS